MHHASAGFDIATSWRPIVLVAMLAVVAATYLRGWMVVRGAAPAIRSAWRPTAFIGGLVSLAAVVSSPLAGWHHESLMAHMIQHLLLTLVSAPLILLGAPLVPLREGMPGPVLPPIRARARVFDDPAVCWGVAMLVFIGWHLPAMFDLAYRSTGWHAIELTTFFASGLVFWWPVVQPWPSTATWPRWSMPLYLFLGSLPCDALSAFLAFSDRVVYRAYATAPRALEDQVSAGALMWLCVTIAYAVPAAVIVINMLSPRQAEV